MPTPPTSTPWVPMWPLAQPGTPVALTYRGDWVAGSYADGDVVINNGVAFLCLGGPTTDVPDTAPWGLGTATSIGTTLPASPLDGQEAILVDSLSAPTYQWRFKYVASILDAYKWVFVGGAAALTEIATAENNITAVAYMDATTPGPQFTVPRAGYYEITPSFNNYGSNLPGGCTVKLGAAAAAVTEGLSTGAGASGSGAGNSISSAGRVGSSRTFKRLLAANDLLKMMYRIDVGPGPLTVADRALRVLPVRVS